MAALFRSIATSLVVLALAACAGLPRERGYAETRELIAGQRAMPADWSAPQAGAPELPNEPLGVEDAVQLAFFHNPRMRENYARLGLGRADLEDARRLANPTFGYGRLSPGHGAGTQITRSLSLGLTDLLLLPVRKRFAQAELDRLQHAVADAVLELATEVEVAWFEAVGAQQIAAMRDLVARAAEQSAELAQRFFDAGNINRLQLEQERAAASQARIDALTAGVNALRARHALASLMGLPANADWKTQTQMPSPRPIAYDADALVPLALESRLDLAAAQRAVGLREDALGVSRRWRWLGGVEVGYEREHELDGGRMQGPSIALELPIFNQGQGGVARAAAELMQARAELDATLLAVQNDARLGLDALQVAHTIAERHRTELVPRREAIVERTQERVNFMLVGVFELLLAKQEEYDAYQAYLESVRDYWVVRAELRGAVGGRLPDDDATAEPSIGVEAILPGTGQGEMDHSKMNRGEMDHSKMDHGEMDHGEMDHSKMDHGGQDDSASDPHAGHRMSEPAPVVDPHAGHGKPAPAAKPDPHAGHRIPAHDKKKGNEDSEDDDSDAHKHDHGDTP